MRKDLRRSKNTQKRVLSCLKMTPTFVSVFHRILDFTRGRISIQPFFCITTTKKAACTRSRPRKVIALRKLFVIHLTPPQFIFEIV